MMPVNNIKCRPASPPDAAELTRISFAAKRIWNYPEAYIKLWEKELTITEKYIEKHKVYVAGFDDAIAGYCSVVFNPAPFMAGEVLIEQGHWMEHLFVDPRYMYKGIGSLLTEYVKYKCEESGIRKLLIFVDPNASGFYEKQGAEFRYMSKSSIPGREIPVYELKV